MAEITQVITLLVNIPTTADPATFDARADNFLGVQLPQMVTEENEFAEQANALAADVTAKSSTATSAANAAQDSETAAVAAANFKGEWSALTGALATPASVRHNGRIWNLLVSIADVTLSEPGVSSDWAVLSQFYLDERTSNIPITLTDFGQIISITEGAFTQTFDSAADLGAGFYCYIRNVGTGTITLDPTETINGLAELDLFPGQSVLIIINSDADAFEAIYTGGEQVMIVVDEKASGAASGPNPSGDSWTTRDLNTVRLNTIAGASLASNVITLPAGGYEIYATSPAYGDVNGTRTRIYNVTESELAILGDSIYQNTTNITATCPVTGAMSFSAETEIRLDHYISTPAGTTTFGSPATTGDPEIYSILKIKKVA